MIAGCPKCGARYRLDAARLRPEGARLRCTRCEAVFRVMPAPTSGRDRPPVADRAAPPAERERARAETTQPPPAEVRRNLVVLADPDVEAAKSLAQSLAAWKLDAVLVHDGVEAILTIQRVLPSAVVLAAELPKMFGFQVCELMKRNESLRQIHVVLVGAVHHRERYRRPPGELYGADAYVERPQLPEALWPILKSFGLPLTRPEPMGPSAAPEAVVPPPVVEPAAPPPVVEQVASPPRDPALAEAVAEAERLARIIVSDVILYNQERFDAGVRAGNVLEALRDELGEGRCLFERRVEARVREQRDFLSEELVRVARSRGMK